MVLRAADAARFFLPVRAGRLVGRSPLQPVEKYPRPYRGCKGGRFRRGENLRKELTGISGSGYPVRDFWQLRANGLPAELKTILAHPAIVRIEVGFAGGIDRC